MAPTNSPETICAVPWPAWARATLGPHLLLFLGLLLFHTGDLRGATMVHLGAVQQIRGPSDLDLEGEIVYAINFSANDPLRYVAGVPFVPDRLSIPGATLVGPQSVAPWQTKPEFGSTTDATALEEILQDIRWANAGAGERLRATLAVKAGDEYKLQILFSANGPEDRRWDIRIDNRDAVDEITSLGTSPGQSYSRDRATLYSVHVVARSDALVVEMGNLFGVNDGANRDPIWQGLTLERISYPPAPEDIVLVRDQFFPGQTAPLAPVRVVDKRVSAQHALALVPGDGDTDNGKFIVAGSDLLAGPVDFSAQPPGSTYSVRLRATDTGDATRSLEKVLKLRLMPPHAPTGLDLDTRFVSTVSVPGSQIGLLTARDPDTFDVHRFQLVAGAGDRDNGLFRVDGRRLLLAGVLPETPTGLQVRLAAIDLVGLRAEQEFLLQRIEPQVRINEALAGPLGGVPNEAGQPQEWIELHNLMAQDLDLTGWHLSDDPELPTKWRIPSAILPGGGFLLVLADATGISIPGSSVLHANFALSASGEWLGLVHPDGKTLASELRLPNQFPGIAFGIGADGDPGYLPRPTPGATNGPVAAIGGNIVRFSVPHGFHTRSFDLELSASLPGSVIRYTLDGTRPTAETGTVYTGPIVVGPNAAAINRGTRIVRAIAVHPDAAISPVATQTYLFVDGVTGPGVDGIVTQSRLNASIRTHATYGPLLGDAFRALPAVSIVMREVLSTTEREASLELIDPNDAEPGFQIDCGIGATGTTSLASPKLAMAARFRQEYGSARLHYPVFARGSMAPGKSVEDFKELRIRGHSHDTFHWLGTRENPPVPYGSPPVTRSGDAQLARNPWIEEMQIWMGQPGKRGRQVHLFLNGAYHGIYHIQERLDEDYMASHFQGSSRDFHFSGGGTTGSDHGGGDTWRTAWSSLKSSLGSYASAQRWVDLTNLCDYMILSFYGGNDWDWSAQHNWSAAGPNGPDRGGWKFFQQDSDIALQDVNADCTDQDVPDGIFTALMRLPDFRVLFRDRVVRHCFGDGMLTPSRAAALYDARMEELVLPIIAESARWQPSSSVGKLPWDRDEEWRNEWKYLRETFFPNRTTRLIEQFRKRSGWWPADPPWVNAPDGVVPRGFEVRFAVASGEVFYTTDGTDPRLPGGQASPNAKTLGGGSSTTTVVLPAGSTWRFLDDGAVPDPGWTFAAFDDSAWREGPAQIGYGDGDEATVAKFTDTDPATAGVQKNLTTYFRRLFDLPNPSAATRIVLRLVRDDGAVVYLNGKEVWRMGMPEGTILPTTPSNVGIGGSEESAWVELSLDSSQVPLQSTGNTVAVEIHQSGPDSSDISFDFEIAAVSPADPVGTLRIDQPTRILARVRDRNDWSGLVEAYLVPEGTPVASPETLVPTEIHYHPSDLPDSEFLELLNASAQTVDFSDVQLAGAVVYRFPKGVLVAPGERIVVVKDTTAFDARYQNPTSPHHRPGLRRFGPWTGSLSNGGERLDILAGNGSIIASFAYGTTGNWPGRADGSGSSLELGAFPPPGLPVAQRNAWLGQPRNWRPSAEIHGTPGGVGTGPDDRIVINEVVSSPPPGGTDAIELVHRTGPTIDLGGWFLSDNPEDLRKYRFPDGTRLEPGTRLVLKASDFDDPTNPACRVPFGLNDTGDDLYLVQATPEGALLRFVDRVEFGPTLPGIPLGRFPDTTGPLVLLATPTLGQSNSNPLPGYPAWALVTFPGGALESVRDPGQDPDEDGIPNFVEYAFGLSPSRADGPPLEVGPDPTGPGILLTHRERAARGTLSYTLQQSADLRSWTPADPHPEIVGRLNQPDGTVRVTVRIPSSEAPRFLRILARE
ncbi:MAG: lamin tail domain-containing protein [Limisphaerales bacterium]